MSALVTLLRCAGWVLALVPLQFVAMALKLPAAKRIPMIFHRGMCRILHLRLEVRGKRSPEKPTLFVANHSSYLDILILGALIRGSFVAKNEVAGWPVFGQLAKLQRSIFVDRHVAQARSQRDVLAGRLEAGENVILFPEGTSSDGNRVLPFKSALFAAAERPVRGRALTVQPVSIAYTKLDDMPMGRRYRPYFAWYGDMELAGHFWTIMGLGPATICVEFHEPVTIERFGSRKALASYCQRVVAEGLSRAIRGRPAQEASRERRPSFPPGAACGQESAT